MIQKHSQTWVSPTMRSFAAFSSSPFKRSFLSALFQDFHDAFCYSTIESGLWRKNITTVPVILQTKLMWSPASLHGLWPWKPYIHTIKAPHTFHKSTTSIFESMCLFIRWNECSRKLESQQPSTPWPYLSWRLTCTERTLIYPPPGQVNRRGKIPWRSTISPRTII